MYKPAYDLKIPDDWFVKFFSILELYNFTIDENTSIDIELSVDPEMLGRIFENLLAEINPETQQTARKATGSYYTPRPIVEYMVDESLIQYLLTKLESFGTVENLPNGSKENSGHSEGLNDDETSDHCEGLVPQPFARSELEQKIRNLLDYTIEENELTKEESLAVIDALDTIKILDPACGSGAFPMGILQKMLLIRQKVDPESIEWVMKQLEMIPDILVRKAFEEKLMDENWDYKYKMSAILHSIYGVDIQTIAVELSKLRFFLTLMVDETVNDDKPNRGINELPNLSFKFVAANTLIGLPEAEENQQMDLMDFDNLLDPMMKKLEILREKFFYASGKEKDRIEREFKKTQSEIGQFLGKEGSTNKRAVALANWDPFADKSSKWFDPKWMFGIKDGFDIVIGNPPWVTIRHKQISKSMLLYFKRNYVGAQGFKLNLFPLFVEFSSQVLNKCGLFSLIVPNRLLDTPSYLGIRKRIIESFLILDIQSLPSGGFENVVAGNIIIIVKNDRKAISNIHVTDFSTKQELQIPYATILNSPNYTININLDPASLPILDKIHRFDNDKLKDICSIHVGMMIKDKKQVLHSNSITKDVIVTGKQIARYLPSSKLHFDYNKIEIFGGTKDKRKHLQFPKLFVRKTGNIILCSIDFEGVFAEQSVYMVLPKSDSIDVKIINSVLNSKIATFYFQNMLITNPEAYPYLQHYDLENLLVPKILSHIQPYYLSVIEKIIANIIADKDTQKLEDQIDLMVYKLYELTYEEVKIVDENVDKVLTQFGLSKEDYERMSVEELSNT